MAIHALPNNETYGPALQKIVAACPQAIEQSNGWWSNPDNPTFDFRENEDGSISMHSWTGRTRDEILSMIGLQVSDIYPRGYKKVKVRDTLDVVDLSHAKFIHPSFLFNLGLLSGYKYKGRNCVMIPYFNADGTQHTRIRVRKAVSGDYKQCWDEGTPGEIIPYGLHRLDMARETGFLLIGEGESDAWACWYHGVPYLGIPGATMQKTLKHIDMGILPPKIYILLEPDQKQKLLDNGQSFYKNVHQGLRKNGYTGEILCIDFSKTTGHKDPSDLHIALWKERQSGQFKEAIHQAIEQAIPASDKHEDIGQSEEITKERLCSFTDDDAGNGDALEALYGQDFLYCPSRGWLYYTKTHWKLDPDGAEVKKKAVATLRARRHAAVDLEKEAIIKCTKAEDKRVNGCINRFRTLVNVSIDDFDNNPDAINCKNGVVNLQTGEITPHSRDQRFTYCIPVAYRPETFSQEWTDYLAGVVGGGQEVIDYLQMALGYSLTGHTREEILFYLFGPPRSGKGTISEIFMSLMPSPLSTGVDFNSFTAKREGDVSNFDLAPLKASRLVFASESLRGQSLNPAKIKQLTGGDRVRACFKHKDFFEYRPQFKVWMLSNWPVNGDPEDDALWGRVRVITFPNSFLGNEDKTKKSRLQKPDALEAILAWGIKGAMDWYALGSKGLTTPEAIKTVTQEQRAELDYVQQWLDECCEGIEEAKECWESNEDVINSYTAWCKNNHVQFPKGPRSLALSLQSKGYKTGVQKKIDGKNTKGVDGMYIYNKVQPKKGEGI